MTLFRDRSNDTSLLEAYNRMLVNEANIPTVDEFVKNLEAEIKKVFPKSLVTIRASTNLGASITLWFALGGNKSQWASGIVENDPVYHIMHIGWNSFMDGHFIKDKIVAELSVGGSLHALPGEGSRYAYDPIKIGFRKITADPNSMIKKIGMYFKKVKDVLVKNRDRVPHPELNGKNF